MDTQYLFYVCLYSYSISRLQSQLTETSSSQGRLQQIIAERESALEDCKKKLEIVAKNAEESQAELDNLRQRINGLESNMAEKDGKISELQSSLAEQSRFTSLPLFI